MRWIFFCASAHNFIKLPELGDLDQLSTHLYLTNGQMKKVVLYIDGFIVAIQRPDHAGDAYFCGRTGKSCDSLNVQYVVDKFGRIRHIVSGIPGSCHDKVAIEWSGHFMAFLDNLPNDYVVLGDPAYRGLHVKVLTTFTGGNLTPEQIQFNLSCTRIRQIVERSIGAFQIKWRLQQLKENRMAAKYNPLLATQCSIAASVLHNRFTNYL